MREAHPGADFLIHPECGCSTSVMEYVAAGDVDPSGVHMLSTGGMLGYAQTAPAGATAIVATETGMLHPLREARPDIDFVAANEAASCRFMKMITLPKLRDALRDDGPRGEGARRPSRSARGCRSSAWSRSASRALPLLRAEQLDLVPDGLAVGTFSSASSTLAPATSASVPQSSFSSSSPGSSCADRAWASSSSPW